jgi:thiol-disulfide isomerase/thioredoxin
MHLQKPLSYLLLLLAFSSFSQNEINPSEVMRKSFEACQSLMSVEYFINHRGVSGKYGYGVPKINAKIIQQKQSMVEDVGFNNAYISVSGTISEKRNESSFSYAFDGENFIFQKGVKSKQKVVSNTTRRVVMGILQQHLFMLRIFPFAEESPYSFQKHSKNATYTFEGEEIKDNQLCYKIKNEVVFEASNGQKLKTTNVWWIGAKDYLPRAYSDNFVYKEISLLSKNKDWPKSTFKDLDESNAEYLSDKEALKELADRNLLKVNTVAPSWEGKTSNGTIVTSESLKGKVVFLDFWGSWCAPCLKAMPQIEQLKGCFSSFKDVVVIGISAKERDKETAERYFKSKGYTYIHIPNGDEVAAKFKVKDFPSVYILNQNGEIALAEKGYDTNAFLRWKEFLNVLVIPN